MARIPRRGMRTKQTSLPPRVSMNLLSFVVFLVSAPVGSVEALMLGVYSQRCESLRVNSQHGEVQGQALVLDQIGHCYIALR